MKRLLLYISVIMLTSSCDRFFQFGAEEVLDDIDLQIKPQLVVEGVVTELDTIQFVKLSTTKSIYSDEDHPIVNNASVQVKGDGETYNFQYVDSLKSYVARFKGQPDVEYALEIIWNGKKYNAKETMANLQYFNVDSISLHKAKFDATHFRYFDPEAPFRDYKNEEILIKISPDHTANDTVVGGEILTHHAVYMNPKNKNEVLTNYQYGDLAEFWFGGDPYVIQAASEDEIMNVYKVSMFAKESQVESNYYRFDIKRNGKSWLQPGMIITANDFAVKENIDGIEFPGFFIEGDEVEFIMYGISREAYNYYVSLQSVLSNDGGNYTSIPGNPPTNVFDEEGKPALGYFEVNKVANLKRTVKAQ